MTDASQPDPQDLIVVPGRLIEAARRRHSTAGLTIRVPDALPEPPKPEARIPVNRKARRRFAAIRRREA